jgi:hypothetical protein
MKDYNLQTGETDFGRVFADNTVEDGPLCGVLKDACNDEPGIDLDTDRT